MALQNSSSLISSIYKSRKVILGLMESQGYDVDEYNNFSINEVNTMFNNKQSDMLLKKKVENESTGKVEKIYIKYYLGKTLRPQNIQEMIDDLYNLEEILEKQDTLMIITKEDMNESLMNLLKHIWEQDGIMIIIQSIKRLQTNILEHVLVPPHRVLSLIEKNELKRKYNIENDAQFPEISRFDAVSQVIGLRPGQICEIIRPSKTAIMTKYYRICV
jgi:DNA-directed RNA polymerase subunit H (RpoH/RPB5)